MSSRGVEIQWQELLQLFYICCDRLNYWFDAPWNATAQKGVFQVEAPDSSQWISKMPNLQPSGQSAELFTQASLKNTVCPKELWLFLWCEAILTSVKPLSIFPFPKSVSLCSSTYTYIHYATYSQMLVNSTEEKHFWSDAGMLTQLTLAWWAHSSLPVAIETDQ